MASFRLPAEPGRLGWLTTGAAVGVLAAVVLAPSFGPTATRAATDTTGTVEHTISVSGTGHILAKPDVADISLGISITRDKAKDSETAAAAAMTNVIAALKAAGIKDADIQTANLSLQPVYDYSGNTQRLTGYQTQNIVQVTVRDLSTVGDTIDAAVQAGATDVSGITFRIDDQTPVETQARAAAMADAKVKADALAKAAGVNITGVQTISEVSYSVPTPVVYANSAGFAKDAAPTTPVQPGNVATDVTVTVVYLIN